MSGTKKGVLVIFDGWGMREERDGNAIAMARTPVFDRFIRSYPFSCLEASGLAVGLPAGVMGNSEVGHMNIGSGRRVVQDQVRINGEIEDGTFFQNPVLRNAFESVRQRHSRVHIIGLLSPGNVHSSESHYGSLIRMAHEAGVAKESLFFHGFLDGRDTPPKSAFGYVQDLERHLQRYGGRIATLIGRFYAMDRDQRWERTEEAYQAMVYGKGKRHRSAEEALLAAYDRGESDEFVFPTVIESSSGVPVGLIQAGDELICFNFRADRMRQLVEVFLRPDLGLSVVTFTRYGRNFGVPVAFPPASLLKCAGEVISLRKQRQFRTAETEKYAHVTYFFNGGRESPFDLEERRMIPSPRVKTYDLVPEMSSKEVTLGVVDRIRQEKDELIVVNFAQPDMVGHTGQFDAAILAVEAGDQSLGQIEEAANDHDFSLFVTADHGNVEMMFDPETKQPHTAHTTNRVPFICVDPRLKKSTLKPGGALKDVIPTIFSVLEIPAPAEMDGRNLLS